MKIMKKDTTRFNHLKNVLSDLQKVHEGIPLNMNKMHPQVQKWMKPFLQKYGLSTVGVMILSDIILTKGHKCEYLNDELRKVL